MYARDHALIATPVGMIAIEGVDAVTRVHIGAAGEQQAGHGAAAEAALQLLDYFAGERSRFDVPLAPISSVRGAILRRAIVDIAYAETASYGALAHAIASSARAIGQACARNPLPLLVPCHRVTGADGPGHYSAGEGLATKIWLLDHERRHRR